MYRVSSSLPHLARALLAGALTATVWVNLSPASYYDVIEWRILDLDLPRWLLPHPALLTPRSIVVDGLMAFFLFFIGKEMWEAVRLERGAFFGRSGLLPMALTLGGMIGAALVWVLTGMGIETAEEASFATGWQVPLGADLLVIFLIGLRVFGPGHPALNLLLLIGIASDVLALLVLGLTLPLAELRLLWLGLPIVACLLVWALYGRAARPSASERDRRTRLRLWPYLVAGLGSWFGVAASGLPPVLGLLPVIPAIARADRSFGVFAEVEVVLHDPLNRFAQFLTRPLLPVLFGFGLVAGGAEFAAFAPTTLVTLASIWLGRPLGMLIIGIGLAALLGLRMPAGVTLRDLLALIGIASLGFTVPILALDFALPGGVMQEAARLGLALSLLSGPLVLLLSLSLRRRIST